MGKRVFVLEPDEQIRQELYRALNSHRFEVSILHGSASLMHRMEREVPVALVLRHQLPRIETFAILRKVQASGLEVPVIIISKIGEVEDKVLTFELGADDYMVEPFDIRELAVRLRNVMRRPRLPDLSAPCQRERLQFGDYELDFLRRRLLRCGVEVSLRAGEFALLRILADHPMQALSLAKISAMLGKDDGAEFERRLDTVVCRLRAVIKVSDSGHQYIQTLRGHGYVFVPDDKARGRAETADVLTQTSVYVKK